MIWQKTPWNRSSQLFQIDKSLSWKQQMNHIAINRSSRPDISCKRSIIKTFAKFTGKHLCWSLFLNIVAVNFIKQETTTQLLIFYQNFQNKYFCKTTPVAAFVLRLIKPMLCCYNWDIFWIKKICGQPTMQYLNTIYAMLLLLGQKILIQ